MSEMIERVALALEPKCRAFGKGDMPMQVAREFARAAIEALREPTDAMVKAGYRDDSEGANDCDTADQWRRMIDAALLCRGER